jgi:ribonuclease HII
MVKIIAGCDESGRGPVLGPLVISCVAIEEDKLNELEKLGVKDSKLLTPKQREKLYDKIIQLAHSYKITIISAQEIDSRASIGLNLNQLEALKIAELIDKINPDVVYVDSPTSPDPNKFEQMIRKDLKHPCDIHAEWKADLHHRIVGASSILSKVTRDREVEKIRKETGLDFGSGYPADPITIRFVKEHWENALSKYIRHSWGTIKELEKQKGQKTLEGLD